MIHENFQAGTAYRSCDCVGCTNKVSISKWPSGAFDSGSYLRAVGPRQGNTRTGYDVCPECFKAGKLPTKAENPQPWPMETA